MKRESIISQLEDPDKVFYFVVIGGGATGLGIALDTAGRYLTKVPQRSDSTNKTFL